MSEYAERNLVELGKHYTKHVQAMTREGLHAKSDIAAELAWRDAEIDRLREWQRQMVEKAASGGRLDGYRELAGKLAAKDAENDRLRAALVAAMEIVQQDRVSLYEVSRNQATGAIEPEDAAAIAELDAIIAQADAALGSEG